MTLPQERIYTTDDIYNLPDGERAELIDGQIYYLSGIMYGQTRNENRNSGNKKTLENQGFLSMPTTGIEPVREVSPAGF